MNEGYAPTVVRTPATRVLAAVVEGHLIAVALQVIEPDFPAAAAHIAVLGRGHDGGALARTAQAAAEKQKLLKWLTTGGMEFEATCDSDTVTVTRLDHSWTSFRISRSHPNRNPEAYASEGPSPADVPLALALTT